MPVLHLLAGPNGSGKSTCVDRVLGPATGLPFVNADRIAAEQWPGAESENAYEASRIAADRRELLIADRRSFLTETVFSHPSKVDLVQRAVDQGYLVTLHVLLIPEVLAVQRVRERVLDGGHPVPEQKIRARFERLWELVVEARRLADVTVVLDNSRADRPFHPVARYQHGELIGTADWPRWTPAALRGSAGA